MPRPSIATTGKRKPRITREVEEVEDAEGEEGETHSVEVDALATMTALDKIRVSIDAVAHGINRLTQVVEARFNAEAQMTGRMVRHTIEPAMNEVPRPVTSTEALEQRAKAKPEPKAESKAEPKADTGPVDLEAVKAALIQYAKVHGREKLVGLFTVHGGTKLADVPPGRLKALKAAAEAGLE
jgi:hypothetical protein